MLNKFKTAARSLVNLQRILSNKVIFQILRKNLATEFVNDLEFKRALVLSPHPDDEMIGVGGAIIKLLGKKSQVKVIHLTDGSEGFPEDARPSHSEKKIMAETREKEARKVQQELGISDVIFLKYKDGKLNASKSLVNYLRQTVRDYKPDAIFVPSFLDPNSDHYETARILYLAGDSLRSNPTILQYEVWSPIYANYYLNIDLEVNKKISAINIYKSQLESRDYGQAIEGINRYRGSMHGKSKYAESFLSTDLKTFRHLAELIF